MGAWIETIEIFVTGQLVLSNISAGGGCVKKRVFYTPFLKLCIVFVKNYILCLFE